MSGYMDDDEGDDGPVITPTLVACKECGLRAIRPTEQDAREIKQDHDSGDCPEDAELERRY